MNWMNHDKITKCTAKFRYRQKDNDVKVEYIDDDHILELYDLYVLCGLNIEDRDSWSKEFEWLYNFRVYKKYAKLNSTYVGSDGMFKKSNRFVIEGEDHIPIRYADPSEPGAVEKCFVHYEVNTKSSKRWSSGFHTIISHGDCKDVLCPPPTWDQSGNIIYGGSDQLLTYFDISSAEVKAAGFASGDPDLIAKFNAGEDIYGAGVSGRERADAS
jgi:hypothetical protein